MAVVTTSVSTTVFLANDEDLYVGQTGHIVPAGVTVGVSGASSSNIAIAGEVAGLYTAISMTGGSNYIDISAGAVVASSSSVAIFFVQGGTGNNMVVNRGTITGGHAGVWDYASGNLIINEGSIFGKITGIVLGSGGSGGPNSIFNSGVIAGGSYSIGCENADDSIVNTGILRGIVSLYGGNDTLDSRTGQVFGAVLGEAGDDHLLLGSTNDILDGGSGGDELSGGAGFDYAAHQYATTGVTANLSNSDLNSGDAQGDTYDSIEGLIGSNHNDALTGDTGANIIKGGTGSDTMTGLAGNDQYYVDNAGDRVIEAAGGGTDRVYASVSYALQAGSAVEVLATMGTASTGNINLTGNELNNIIVGNAGINQLRGLGGNDTLNGVAGNDLLWGGLGIDTLTGGPGLDHFLFDTALNAATNVDRIIDFLPADDTIRLENAVFAGLETPAGSFLSATEFRVGAAAADASDRIIYNNVTGALIHDSNGNLAGGATQFATLAAGLALTSSDFLVF